MMKATMNDRPEQVVAFVQQTIGPGCAIVVTYDTAVAFDVARADLPRTLIVSPFRGPIFGGSRPLPTQGCDQPRLYAVESYLGGTPHHFMTYHGELEVA